MVASRVAEAIVEGFEMIYVDQQNSKWSPNVVCPIQGFFQGLVKMLSVRNAGERIDEIFGTNGAKIPFQLGNFAF